jgi:hypothetical protein
VAAQLSGKSKGYAPQQLGFGPPPGGGGGPFGKGNQQAITEQQFRTEVSVPPEFEATLFGAPPRVNYPVAIACEPTGAVYVAVDEQGSLGRTPGGGKILRCVDKDGDGKVDDVAVYAKVDHPRDVVTGPARCGSCTRQRSRSSRTPTQTAWRTSRTCSSPV